MRLGYSDRLEAEERTEESDAIGAYATYTHSPSQGHDQSAHEYLRHAAAQYVDRMELSSRMTDHVWKIRGSTDYAMGARYNAVSYTYDDARIDALNIEHRVLNKNKYVEIWNNIYDIHRASFLNTTAETINRIKQLNRGVSLKKISTLFNN